MHSVTSFHGSSLPAGQLTALMADYVALDQARIYRRLFLTRFGALGFVLGLLGFGFHWLPPFATWFGVAFCAIAPASAWVAELRCDWKLAKRLSELPGGTTHAVVRPDE